jgi:transcriptional regulator with XRE-family HTH domain
MPIGKGIRTARLAAGLSQAKLAKLLSLDVMTVSRWERGKMLPSGRHLIALAKALKVDPARLVR